MGKILIVDDDKNICKLISLYLTDAGYELEICHNGSAALDHLHNGNIDLVLLDVMIPIINGWEVCKIIRSEYGQLPVILVTAKELLEDKLTGFEAGADDYLIKPFEPKELIARVNAKLRNKNNRSNVCDYTDRHLKIKNLNVDLDRYEVKIDEVLIELKPKEIQLLFFLIKNKNIVFSREQLLDQIWDYAYSGDTRTVDVHIKSLRDKLGHDHDGWEIKTIWGVGYKLEVR